MWQNFPQGFRGRADGTQITQTLHTDTGVRGIQRCDCSFPLAHSCFCSLTKWARDNDWVTVYLSGMKPIGLPISWTLFKCFCPWSRFMFHLSDSYFLWGRKEPHRHNISRASVIKEAPTICSEKPHSPSLHSPVDNQDPKHVSLSQNTFWETFKAHPISDGRFLSVSSICPVGCGNTQSAKVNFFLNPG